uniref:Uncharacterized protein n=1 Tax=Sphaerodactylus townsendi TaxID=933632 RepID=A0ACB8EEV0_9SAUR
MAGEESAELPGLFPGEALQAPAPEILGVPAVPPAPDLAGPLISKPDLICWLVEEKELFLQVSDEHVGGSSRKKPWRISPPSPSCDDQTRPTTWRAEDIRSPNLISYPGWKKRKSRFSWAVMKRRDWQITLFSIWLANFFECFTMCVKE